MDTSKRQIGLLDKKLERMFSSQLSINQDLDRRMVSFQGNRKTPIWRWLKFKEAFSARLVSYVLNKFCVPDRGGILDPFAGTGSTIFGASARGCSAVGIEILPVAVFDMETKKALLQVSGDDFFSAAERAMKTDFRDYFDGHSPFDQVAITANAFPRQNARAVCGYRNYCGCQDLAPPVEMLLRHAGMAVLEIVSYTRKDGQYLRWDGRAPGRKSSFRKHKIEDFSSAIRRQLNTMCEDLRSLYLTSWRDDPHGEIQIIRGSCLGELPGLAPESAQLVLTSPPYCNRYDYTRTYALELVYLGFGADDIKDLRQRFLSCTVENKEKRELLQSFYSANPERLERAQRAFSEQELLQTILAELATYREAGALNNPNIVRMIANYFFEMSVVIHEVARVLKKEGRFVMVNDNVRYAGITIPVDLILSDIAEKARLRTDHLWVLPTPKGNSSQQMAKHGRHTLRKSVYVWTKAD